jgi:Flp pilus assembly protein TadD
MNTLSRAAAPLLVALPWVLGGAQAAAQDHAVVQPLPPRASGELTAALQRLARSPADFDALIAAGRASLELNDIDAATGFFGRADVVRPGDARVKAGLASANLKSDRPIEALQMFDQAQAAGAAPASLAGDRGLAYDLVGDNVSAQAQYRLALSQGPDPEISRRLGLSLAISGDKKGFEATLLPLLQRRDFAAYRARAFGLAILGDQDEAVSIVEAVMPRDLASRITPYLGYMPKLTRAQQAAAGNLGAFPRAAQIGRDDPRFAQYSGPSTVPATQGGADSRLAPAGQPLGPRKQAAPATSQRQTAADRKRQREASRKPAEERRQTLGVTSSGRPVIAAPATTQAVSPPSSPPPAQASASLPAPVIELPPQPVVVAELPPSTAAPGFALAPSSGAASAPPVVVLAAPPAEEDVSVADAFADLSDAHRASAPVAGAVDITAIKPRREVVEPPKPPPPPPPPPKPKAPSRVWVQVATGKDLKALAFDWRRFGKKAPELLAKRDGYTAKWGESRRLVTGPFDSEKAASKFVNELKKAGVDSFTFTSDAGEEVTPLK